MKEYINKIRFYVLGHKVISAVLLVIIVLVGYWGYGKLTSTTGETRYVLAKVTKGTIVSAVTGSGQVSALNQIDIKPNVSGTITSVAVQPGDKIASGKLLFSIDSTDAQKAVRDAEVNLASAKISLAQLKITKSSENISADLSKNYDDGFSAVVSTFSDLPSIITDLENILNQAPLSENSARGNSNTALNYRTIAETAYFSANDTLAKNIEDYKTLSYDSPRTDLDNIIEETYNTTKLSSEAVKDLRTYVDFMSNTTSKQASSFSSYQTTLSAYANTVSGHLSSLLSAQTNIKNSKDSSSGSDLDIQSAELSITQKENALQDAKDKLSDYSIRAPFAGTIASVPVQKGDSVGPGTTLGTIITTQQIATISLNEVDIAKIQLGQKVTLTFDAVADLTITGKVAQIDSIGTVSQGVVNYNVKISFDTTDLRIKPGMSANAAIITNVAQDVLTVPNSAVKNQNGSTYVQIFDTLLPSPLPGIQGSPSKTPPSQQTVVIGVSDNTSTEIVSGLKEGDEVVSRTILPTTTTTTATPSILGTSGGGNRGGGAVRIGG